MGAGGTVLPEPPDDLRQALAERYVLERELGHGGSATVYLALDLKYRRSVAIKVLSKELALAVRVERFQREIDTAVQLNHAHILPLFEADSLGGYLFYTMPPAEGESLRERIERDGALPIDDAVRIAGQVADALDYAHRRGVVHRDIKPGNILMSDGHARVADFGIARAIAGDSDATVTVTGSPMGTPAYMSPEQIRAAVDLDGRSDIYSLGCVLYEMLAGEPPFTGPPESIIARHLADPLPSLGTKRRDTPKGLERIVERATAKAPSHRFRTAGELRHALRLGDIAPPKPSRIPRTVAIAAVFGLSMMAGGGPPNDASSPRRVRASALRPLHYAILPPFEYQGSVIAPVHEDQLLYDALTWWRDVSVADPLEVRAALERRGGGALTSRTAQQVAVELRARYYIRGEVSRIGDSLRIHAALYDAGTNAHVRDASVRVGADLRGASSAFAALAEHLLFGDDERTRRLGSDHPTRSFLARREYARGLAAVEQWELAAADSAFVAATQHDPLHAQAHLWLAQVRSWHDAPPAAWRSAAERAATGRQGLASRDQVLSDALLALARGEVERACATWGRLATRTPDDFVAWYGWGNCLSRDSMVVRDPTSRSGWRFRSSYHQAIKAYHQAFRLLPSIHRSLRSHSFEAVRRLLMTDRTEMRVGRAVPPDTARFHARAAWQGDSLVLVPFTQREVAEIRPWARAPTANLAVQHQRQLFREIATAWAAADPQSADALEALALSLEMLSDPFCLDTLRRARSLATDPDQRARLAGAEAWVRLKFAIPGDLARLRVAKALADSLLRAHPPTRAREPVLLASLAAVTGRAHLAASLNRHPAAALEWLVPGPIAGDAPALLVFAALGGPSDSLRALERWVEAGIERLPEAEQQPNRLQWLGRPAMLAFPNHRLGAITKLAGAGSSRVDALAAFIRGDTIAVQQFLANWRTAHQGSRPMDLTLDALYVEAWLLAALRDDHAAIAWLDPTLNALWGTAPQIFADPARAGALVRAIALRAELAERVGDRATARQWATVVVVLWSDADEFLEPVVLRMKRLAA